MSEHAVIVEFQYGQSDLNPLFSLEDRLRTAIESAGCREYDGHEIAMDGSEGTLYYVRTQRRQAVRGRGADSTRCSVHERCVRDEAVRSA